MLEFAQVRELALQRKIFWTLFTYTGIRCETVIGVWEWEKAVKQTLVVDLDLAIDNRRSAGNDDLNDALDYQALTERVNQFADTNKFQLIETFAEKLCELVLDEFDTPWLRARVDKGQAVKGVKNVGVIIERGDKPED